MKWKILAASLVLSAGLCNYGFGFDLLDQLLGVRGYGGCDTGCCETPAPSCHAPPVPCCKPQPTCCAPKPCHSYRCIKICLPRLEIPLPRISFCRKCICGHAHCGGCGGCNAGPPAEVEAVPAQPGEAVPPPAPVVDPSAFLPSTRSVAKNTSVMTR